MYVGLLIVDLIFFFCSGIGHIKQMMPIRMDDTEVYALTTPLSLFDSSYLLFME